MEKFKSICKEYIDSHILLNVQVNVFSLQQNVSNVSPATSCGNHEGCQVFLIWTAGDDVAQSTVPVYLTSLWRLRSAPASTNTLSVAESHLTVAMIVAEFPLYVERVEINITCTP